MDQLNQLLGVLGAYITIIMAVAIFVERILDAVKLNKWLNELANTNGRLAFLDVQKSHVSPDQLMRDVSYWISPRSQPEMQVAVLNHMTETFPDLLNETTKVADATTDTIMELVSLTGIDRYTATTQTRLAQKMYSLRQSLSATESVRIARLQRLSALIGIIISLALKLDMFMYLSPISPAISPYLNNPVFNISGMVLTGMAASMGSGFWHDALDRLRAVKESTRTIQQMQAQTAR